MAKGDSEIVFGPFLKITWQNWGGLKKNSQNKIYKSEVVKLKRSFDKL
jgi:hypothetical protein